ncbi:glutaminase A [Anaerococcus nagyae]|uniref:glutaminase A n=1 Tax=Anaerococcus nagyae TaxID=1755241 RepID=UPI001AE97596|nr:glutaminase A [Anaerococcus nagyae]MBP2069257.1 glutaminase [Anaerococcus nagyae]
MYKENQEILEIIDRSIKKSEIYIGKGKVATYIPELANVNPENFALSIVSVDGGLYEFGDTDTVFSMQSISKVISLIMALKDNDADTVFKKIGTEASKYKFNSVIPIDDKPSNPFINAGAITTSSLIKGDDILDKFDRTINMVRKLANSNDIRLIEEVYLSEMQTTDINRAIAYYLKSKEIFTDDAEKILDLYIRNCSIGLNSSQLAHIGAILANGGVSIDQSEEIISKEIVKTVISQMASCGMYEKSGQYLLEVGIPSKSGVSGAILGVVPGKYGICVYSPRLDESGNSVRGTNLLKILSNELDLNIFL